MVNKIKKVALVVKNTTFHKNFGGLEVHTKSLIDLLAENYQVDVFSPKGDLKNDFLKEENKEYFFIDCNYKTGLFSDFVETSWYQKFLKFFIQKNDERKYDLFISISSAGYPVISNKNYFNFKILTVSHGTALSEFKSLIREFSLFSFPVLKSLPYFLYNYFYKQPNFILNSDKVVCVGEFVRDNLRREVGSKTLDLFKVIFNGVEIEEVEKTFEREGKLKVLFAGRLERSKGVLDLIESVRTLDVDLFVAGSGNLKDEAVSLVNSHGIQTKVNFLGKLTSKELKEYYLKSDILVVPSLRVEGFPMSIIEGMSYYLPVIATKSGGNVDAVVDNKTGFLIDVGDTKNLTEKLKYFDTYPEKIKEFGLNARNSVEHKFSLGIMKTEYKNLIESMVK